MMSAWWLVLIIPASAAVGILTLAVLFVTRDKKE